MSPTLLALLASVYSLMLLILLALSDPKRARVNREKPAWSFSRIQRRILAMLLGVPLLLFVLLGYYAPLFLWLGSVMVAGWLVALFLASRAGDQAESAS